MARRARLGVPTVAGPDMQSRPRAAPAVRRCTPTGSQHCAHNPPPWTKCPPPHVPGFGLGWVKSYPQPGIKGPAPLPFQCHFTGGCRGPQAPRISPCMRLVLQNEGMKAEMAFLQNKVLQRPKTAESGFRDTRLGKGVHELCTDLPECGFAAGTPLPSCLHSQHHVFRSASRLLHSLLSMPGLSLLLLG